MISIKMTYMAAYTVNGFAYAAFRWDFWNCIKEARQLRKDVMAFLPEHKVTIEEQIKAFGAINVRNAILVSKCFYLYIRFFNREWTCG